MGDSRAASCCGCSSPVGLCHGAGCREGSAGPTAPVGRGRAMDEAGASVSLCASVGALEASSEVAVSPRSPGEPGLAGDTAGAPCTSPSPPPGEVAGLSPACPARRETCPGFSAAPDTVPFSGARWDDSVVPTAPSSASPASPDPGAAGPAVTPPVPLSASSHCVVSSPSASGLGMEEGALPSPWLSPGRVTPSPAAPVAVASSAVTRGPGGLPVVGSAPAAAGGRAVGRDVALSVGSKSAPSLVTDARTSANRGVAPGGAAGVAPITPSSELGVKAGWGVKTKAAAETVWFPWDALRAVATSVTAWGSPLGACVAAPGLGQASASLPAAGAALVTVSKSASAPEGKVGLAGRPVRMLWVVSVSATALLVPAVPAVGAPRASLCAAVGEAVWAPSGPSVLSGTATAAPSPAGSTGQGVNGGNGARSPLLLGWEHRGWWDSGAGGDTKQAGAADTRVAAQRGIFRLYFAPSWRGTELCRLRAALATLCLAAETPLGAALRFLIFWGV